MPRTSARLVGSLLLLAFAVPVAPVAGRAASPAPDTVEEAMPYLGYTARLPASWERVVGDTSRPVPAMASIEARDDVTAQALIAAAQHIAADGGLLDPMGLWAVDPATLLQLGVLAGQPYRISPDDVRAVVDQSLADRASDMADPVVDPVALPVGSGFRATYLNASDLAQHVEYHLRTPTGRYLLLASSLPGLFDDGQLATVDAVARSLTPIPGSAGDRAPPTPLASSAPATDLLASLPPRVGSIEMDRQLLDGESLVGASGDGSGSLASSLGVLLSVPADLTLAVAVPSTSDQDLLVAAYGLTGVDQAALDQVVATFPGEVWTRSSLGSVDVLTSVRGAGGRRTWLWTGSLADGDAVLYQVESTNAPLARAAIRATSGG